MSAFRPTFVSHAHIDNNLCDRYVAALRARGIDVWYDRNNMQVGHSLSATIDAELRKRTALVVIATPAALASQWVLSEIAAFRSLAAHDPTRLFVPVRAAPCEMPLLWADIVWIDALAMPFEEAIARITSTLAVPTPPATLAPPETPSRRPASPLPTRSLPPRAPDETPRRPTRPSDILEMISLASMQSLYDGYMALYVDRVTRELDYTMAALRAELRDNDAKEASYRPSAKELVAIERLQNSGVTGMDLLDRMVEQGEDWLMVTMRRLDHFERTGQAPKDYSTWCEHALSGAYDWMDPGRGGDASDAPRTNSLSPTSKVPEWLSNVPRQSAAQQGPDDNDDKGRNIFRIFTN